MNGAAFIVSCLVCVSLGQAAQESVVATNFAELVSKVKVQKLEPYVEYGDYFNKFAKLNELLINDLTTELFRQTRLQSHELVQAVSTLQSKLDHDVENINSNSGKPLDLHLKQLNEHLQAFLKMRPGHVYIKRKPLPDIPKRNVDIHNFVKYHTLKNIFLNMGTIIDTHMSSIDVLLHKLYTAGWQGARRSYDEIQDHFRQEFLNGPMLHTFDAVVSHVLGKKSQVEAFLVPETWSTFEDLAGQIKTISDDVKESADDRIFNRTID